MPQGYNFSALRNYEDALSSQIPSIDWPCGKEFEVKEPKSFLYLVAIRRKEHYGSDHNSY